MSRQKKTERNQDWCDRYRRGETVTDMAKADGVSRQRIYQVLNRESDSVETRRALREARRQAICDKHLEGIAPRKIAFEMECSVSFVNDVIRGSRRESGAEPVAAE